VVTTVCSVTVRLEDHELEAQGRPSTPTTFGREWCGRRRKKGTTGTTTAGAGAAAAPGPKRRRCTRRPRDRRVDVGVALVALLFDGVSSRTYRRPPYSGARRATCGVISCAQFAQPGQQRLADVRHPPGGLNARTPRVPLIVWIVRTMLDNRSASRGACSSATRSRSNCVKGSRCDSTRKL